jgi:hypothetical protein
VRTALSKRVFLLPFRNAALFKRELERALTAH